MKFIDTIKSLPIHKISNCVKRRRIIKGCDETIKIHLGSVDIIRKTIDDTEKAIHNWQNDNENNKHQALIETFQACLDLYELSGKFFLINLDVRTAFKFLFKANTDYECRFFVRRIYTLMYETKKGLAIPTGTMYKELASLIGNDSLVDYKNAHQKLVRFLDAHQTDLKNVRNRNEAHKTEQFKIQLASIEQLSISKSIDLIEEYSSHLYNLNSCFMNVLVLLSKHTNSLRK